MGGRARKSGALGAAVVLALLGAAAGASGAGTEVNFSAIASAEGSRMTYEVPNYLVVSTFMDGGGPVAQSTLASTGASQSFASLPYPGDTAIAFPGLVAGFGGPELPAGYPFYVSAENPTTPEKSLDDPSGQGGYHLHAAAADRKSTAEAVDRVGGEQAWIQRSTATSSVERAADGTVVSTAESIVEGITIGDQLRIGSVRSRSVARLAPGAKDPTIERSMSITGASVGGTNVVITENGVMAGPQTVPAPTAELTKSVNENLKQAGIEAHVVKGQPIAGGGLSDVLLIRSRHPLPLPENPQGILTFTIGGTSASILAVLGDLPGSPLPGEVATPPAIGSTDPQAFQETAPPDVSPGVPASGPDGGSVSYRPVSGVPGGLPVATPTGLEPTVPAPVAAGDGGGQIAAAPTVAVGPVARDLSGPVTFLYIVLAVGAAAGLAGSALWRSKGVATPWTS